MADRTLTVHASACHLQGPAKGSGVIGVCIFGLSALPPATGACWPRMQARPAATSMRRPAGPSHSAYKAKSCAPGLCCLTCPLSTPSPDSRVSFAMLLDFAPAESGIHEAVWDTVAFAANALVFFWSGISSVNFVARCA